MPNVRVYSDVERLRSDMIQDILRKFGGYTARAIRAGIRGDLNRLRNYRNYPRKNSNPGSNPSDPDSELMRDQAATQIQRRIRGRQSRQMRNYTRRNTGIQSLNPTMRERFRRFTDHNRMLDENDPLSGYLHDVYFPPKMTSKSSQSKSKRKVAKRTKKRTIFTILSFYLIFLFADEKDYDKNRILCTSHILQNIYLRNRTKNSAAASAAARMRAPAADAQQLLGVSSSADGTEMSVSPAPSAAVAVRPTSSSSPPTCRPTTAKRAPACSVAPPARSQPAAP
eukprot:COSAG06_NODE_439_length_15765_cov_69.583812_9_plen_282_part_00